jgi:hypothetical protein
MNSNADPVKKAAAIAALDEVKKARIAYMNANSPVEERNTANHLLNLVAKARNAAMKAVASTTDANNDLDYAARKRTALLNAVTKYSYWTEHDKTANGTIIWTYFAHNNLTGATQRVSSTVYSKESANFARGGLISGPGTKTSDSIPANLSNGEFVVKADAVSKYGLPVLESLNNMSMLNGENLSSKYNNKFSMGGPVMAKYAEGGAVNDSSVYNNYSINVNVEGTNASADDIANKVMNALKRRENMIGTRTRI